MEQLVWFLERAASSFAPARHPTVCLGRLHDDDLRIVSHTINILSLPRQFSFQWCAHDSLAHSVADEADHLRDRYYTLKGSHWKGIRPDAISTTMYYACPRHLENR